MCERRKQVDMRTCQLQKMINASVSMMSVFLVVERGFRSEFLYEIDLMDLNAPATH